VKSEAFSLNKREAADLQKRCLQKGKTKNSERRMNQKTSRAYMK
jgi:hypothetical protein